VISYTFIKQPEKLFQSEIVKTKYKTSPLSESDLYEYSKKLNDIINEKKLYLDSDINLSNLARYLDISTHTLSQVINQYYKTNFYDFINKFRIKEVKSQLLKEENKNLTIIAIAFEAGFNSKSSFNKIFKKYVGKSPTRFMIENGIDYK
jgi:AraC-like DNA-binding protein